MSGYSAEKEDQPEPIEPIERKVFLSGYAVIAAAILLINTVNVLTVLDDFARTGRALAPWEPAVWEATSAASALCFAWLAYAALRISSGLGRSWIKIFLVHFGAALLYSAAHVATMVSLRFALYELAGDNYRFGPLPSEFVYEFRKDLVAYLFFVTTFAATRAFRHRRSTPENAGRAENGREDSNPVLTISDGPRVRRVPIGDVLGVASAGNYVEVLLASGRRELMRSTLTQLEQKLAPHGFVRTHRSWLVSKRAVSEVAARGGGDYELTLLDGTRIPLSRRFPEAREALRAEKPTP